MKILSSRSVVLATLLVALLIAAFLLEPRFLTIRSQSLLSSHIWELAIVSVPMLLIIMIGGIDLSVGSIVALSAVAFGIAFKSNQNVLLASLAALATGVAAGFCNGWFVARVRVHPLVVTLATLAAFRGLAEGVSLAKPFSGYPEGFLRLSSGTVAGIPYPAILFALAAIWAWIVLSRMQFGRWIVAIGTDERVAVFTRIRVDRIKLILYTLSGFSCGIVSILMVARNNTAKADIASGMELEAITAVVLGGASIQGGKGSVIGLVLALGLVHELREFVTWHWKKDEFNLVVLGCLLIGALLFERGLSWRKVSQPRNQLS